MGTASHGVAGPIACPAPFSDQVLWGGGPGSRDQSWHCKLPFVASRSGLESPGAVDLILGLGGVGFGGVGR